MVLCAMGAFGMDGHPDPCPWDWVLREIGLPHTLAGIARSRESSASRGALSFGLSEPGQPKGWLIAVVLSMIQALLAGVLAMSPAAPEEG